MAADNKTLVRFILDGIPPAPRCVPQVEVTFDLDASGILKVAAKDKASGKEQHITITNSTNLSEDEIKRMQAEAEKYAAEDSAKKARVEARNQADTMIFTAEKAIKDSGDKIKPELKSEVEDKIKAVRDILDTGSKEDLDTKTKDLMDSMQKIGSAMYEQPKEESGDSKQDAGGTETPKEETVKTEEGEVVS